MLLAAAILWPFVSRWLAERHGCAIRPYLDRPYRVSVVISARNESRQLGATLYQLKAVQGLDLHIIVVSDGSSDDTVAVATSAGADIVLDLEVSIGKTRALTEGLSRCRSDDIIIFMDATTVVNQQSLLALISPFSDPTVGATSGLVLYDYSSSPMGIGFRWYQSLIVGNRITDGHWFSCPSVSGALCAFRPYLWRAETRADITPDLAIPFWCSHAGLRTVLVTEAVCSEVARTEVRSVFKARLRMALQAYGFMSYAWAYRHGLDRRYAMALFGQKICRWAIPISTFMILSFASTLWPQVVLVALLTVGSTTLLARLPGGGQLFGAPYFVLVVISAYVVGLLHYLAGRRAIGWDPAQQRT